MSLVDLFHLDNDMKEKLQDFYPTMKSDKPPYTLDSTSRFEYQQPQLHGNLKNSTTRYGCNSRRQNPAIGAGKNHSYSNLTSYLNAIPILLFNESQGHMK